ncbi:unnamed protein product, partial [Meganyctiphanes norvegica]
YSYTCITLKVWRYSRYRRGYVPLKTIILKRLCCLQEGDLPTGVYNSSGGDSGPSGSISTVRVSRVSLVAHSHPGVPQPLSLAKVKTIKLTTVVTALFIICHAPFTVTMLYSVFGPPSQGAVFPPLGVILLLLPSLPSCVNPWIYLFFSESLLNQLRVCLRRGLRRPKENLSI